MSTTVTTFKFFWAHEDEQQEAWLRSMARHGWHLKGVNALSLWTFTQGEPADVAYRVDFFTIKSTAEYCRLFQDAGWERAAEIGGSHYWRKRVVDGREPEIHTDTQSKIAKFQRMLFFMALTILPLPLVVMSMDRQQIADQWPSAFLICTAVMVPMYALMACAVMVRIRALRKES